MFAAAARISLIYGPAAFAFSKEAYNAFKKWRKSNKECPVCKQKFNDNSMDVDFVKVSLPVCKHLYHLKCLNELRTRSTECMICGDNIDNNQNNQAPNGDNSNENQGSRASNVDNSNENEKDNVEIVEITPNNKQKTSTSDSLNKYRDNRQLNDKYKPLQQPNNNCPVCKQKIEDKQNNLLLIRIVLDECKHSYHSKCLKDLSKRTKDCIICCPTLSIDSDSHQEASNSSNKNQDKLQLTYKKIESWSNSCSVCYQKVNNKGGDLIGCVLPDCGHSYHFKCLNELRKKSTNINCIVCNV